MTLDSGGYKGSSNATSNIKIGEKLTHAKTATRKGFTITIESAQVNCIALLAPRFAKIRSLLEVHEPKEKKKGKPKLPNPLK